MSYREQNMLFSAAYLLCGALGLSTKPVSMARNAAYLARNLTLSKKSVADKKKTSKWTYSKGE